MERLTYFKDGYWRVNFSGVQYQADFVDRLAAYEDIGLTPEEIKAPFTEDTMIKLAAQALGVETSRLRGLAEADKDGRVVVQPCKQGDELWTYCNYPVKRVYSFTVAKRQTISFARIAGNK